MNKQKDIENCFVMVIYVCNYDIDTYFLCKDIQSSFNKRINFWGNYWSI